MGFIQTIKGWLAPKPASRRFSTFTEYTPTYTTWNGSLYEQELMRSCVHSFANACSKLEPHYDGPIQQVETLFRTWPNEHMTWSRFLYRLATIYEVDCTAFVIRLHDQLGRTTGLWPIKCNTVEAMDVGGEMWFEFDMPVGNPIAYPAKDVCVLSKYQYVSDLFGTPNKLSDTLSLLNAQAEAERTAIAIGSKIMFIGRMVGQVDEEDMDEKKKRFAEQNLGPSNSTGMLTYDQTWDSVTPVSHNAYTIDAQEMQRIDDHVFNYFGINKHILQNDCTEEIWDSYYEGKIETWAIQLSEGLNKMMFTSRSMLTNSITFTANRMQFMSAASKRNMVRDMTDRRIITINEGREIIGLPKVDGGDVFVNRGEYMVLDMEGNVIYTSGGNLASSLPPSDIEDSPMADLGGDDDIYEDVDGKYEGDKDKG